MTDNTTALNQYWSQPLDSLLTALRSTPGGLSMAEAGQRLGEFGPNALEAREKATALGLFLNQFKSPIILILLFATGVSAEGLLREGAILRRFRGAQPVQATGPSF